jgi:glycosyltransferase involved in cell wall biosynthesis
MTDAGGLNLLFVSPYPPRYGGTAASLHLLTTALAERGAAVRVLAPIPFDQVDFDEEFVPALAGIRLHRFVVPYFLYIYDFPFDEGYWQVERREIRRILPELIEDERPDLIVAAQEPLAWCVPGIAGRRDIPCVLLLRGSPTSSMIDGSMPAEHRRSWLDAFGDAERIVAVAHHFESGLRGLGLDRIQTIPNHVDLTRFAPGARDPQLLRRLGIDAETRIVLHASKIEPVKRPLDLVRAAGALRDEQPGLVFLIVGDGPLLAEMKEAAERHHVADAFRFTGWVPYELMPRLLNLADVVVQPSEAEGMSRVYLESMACARILLASDIPAAREVVRHGENGFLFPVGDLGHMVEAIRLVIHDAPLRASVGAEARASVSAHSLDRRVDEYLRVFRDVLDGRPAPPSRRRHARV